MCLHLTFLLRVESDKSIFSQMKPGTNVIHKISCVNLCSTGFRHSYQPLNIFSQSDCCRSKSHDYFYPIRALPTAQCNFGQEIFSIGSSPGTNICKLFIRILFNKNIKYKWWLLRMIVQNNQIKTLRHNRKRQTPKLHSLASDRCTRTVSKSWDVTEE